MYILLYTIYLFRSSSLIELRTFIFIFFNKIESCGFLFQPLIIFYHSIARSLSLSQTLSLIRQHINIFQRQIVL